jgi:hypothetical protein
MEGIGVKAVTIVVSIIGLAMLAVALSRQAQTPQVIEAAGSALGNIIKQAVAPVASNSNLFGSTAVNTNGIPMPSLTGGF